MESDDKQTLTCPGSHARVFFLLGARYHQQFFSSVYTLLHRGGNSILMVDCLQTGTLTVTFSSNRSFFGGVICNPNFLLSGSTLVPPLMSKRVICSDAILCRSHVVEQILYKRLHSGASWGLKCRKNKPIPRICMYFSEIKSLAFLGSKKPI